MQRPAEAPASSSKRKVNDQVSMFLAYADHILSVVRHPLLATMKTVPPPPPPLLVGYHILDMLCIC